MTSVILSSPLDYYARNGAALLRIDAGAKGPTYSDWHNATTRDRAQWQAWVDAGMNVGVHSGNSNWIVVDLDVKGEGGRDGVWHRWHQLCAAYGDDGRKYQPQISSRSAGFHIYFTVPAGLKITKRVPAEGIELRAGKHQTVVPPSQVDGLAYSFFAEPNPPYPAPQWMIDICAGKKSVEHRSRQSDHSLRDVTSLLRWAKGRGWFDAYDDWISIGQALKVDMLDDGLALWQSVSHGGKYNCGDKWRTFADSDDGNAITLNSFFKRAIADGWRVTAEEMFDGVPTPTIAPTNCATIGPRRINAATLEGKPVPERQWLVRDLIPAGNVTLLYGDGGTGKSLLALQLGAAIASGTHFFGRPVARGGVEFITAEDSLDEMHRRLTKIAGASGVPLSALDGLNLTSLAEADALLAVPEDNRGGGLVATALYDELNRLIAETRPAALVLDTLADVYGGNEIIRAQARQFIGMLRRLALAHGCTVIVLAHPSLSGMDKGTSGSTAWSNSVRSRLYLSRVHETDGRELDEDLRVLRVGKLNYGRVGTEIEMRWCNGVFDPVAVASDPLLAGARAERVFLDLLTKYTAQDRNVSVATGANYAPKVFDAEARLQRVSKRDLTAAMGRLLESGRIRNVGYGPASRGTKRLEIVSTDNYKSASPPV